MDLVDLPADALVAFPLFAGIAALSERVLYPQFVTDLTADLPQYQKDKIESADFASLRSKLEGIKVPPTMLRLLQIL
jgi:hypothetical protein